ncbi:MAG: nucleotidyltransferase domain-containing protein, partial [Bacteroidota bacterium]
MQTAIYKQIIDRRKIKETSSSAGIVLELVAYFDLFDHPVSIEDIQLLLSDSMSKEKLVTILSQLQNDKHLFRHGEFYSLRNEPLLANKRIKRNDLAQPMIIAAHKAARFFFRFPYVRGIGISGSLSKNVAEEDSDIDFFIITKANRLWITRTFMCLFNKLFYLVRRRHLYCFNYFIDEEA